MIKYRLNARMSTPNSNYGPNPAPKFTGYQEFFKEFIDIASNPVFNQLLMDNLNLEAHKVQTFNIMTTTLPTLTSITLSYTFILKLSDVSIGTFTECHLIGYVDNRACTNSGSNA
jgi:hypothetical protein